MFNNLIKLSNGRTTTKILATLLVITLTFANFALLGTFMFESIAIDSVLAKQDNSTNSKNVKFEAYFDLTDTTVREVSKDINAEDLVLHVAVSVEGNGRLEKGTIDFSDSNFNSKENEKILKKEIDTISAGNKIIIDLPIVSRKDSNFNLSLLNMISKIKLTGQYIDENGNITDIDPNVATKEVKVNWTTNEITDEQVNVSGEVITNKICQIDGANKRVLQVLVKTNLQNNKLPVELTKIEIQNPIEGVAPEKVRVTTFNTSATNGGNSLGFNEQQKSSWEYKKDENKTYIELINVADENGMISWQKNAADELIITYVYDEQTQITSIKSNIKAIIKVHNNDNEVENEYSLELETIEEKGNIVKLQSSIDENIYKGNMYLNQDTEYKTKYDIFVSYANGNNIYLVDSGDKANSENLATYYKKTLINKAQAINVLGNEGTIKIYNGANTKDPISEIILSQENSEEYFVFEYPTDINNVVIETSAPLKEGKIEIINEKIVKVVKLEKIEEATKIDALNNVVVANSENKAIENCTETKVANLVEPKASIDLLLDKQTISSQVENDLILTAVLNTNNNSNKLFENPTINIELPKEITEVALLQDISLLYEDELEIVPSDSAITTNENGNKVISIALQGKQTKYDASANIVMKLKVKANPFMADKEVEIKTKCIINDIEEANISDKINISSEKGILTKNSITIGENKIEDISNIITTSISKNEEIKINSLIINNNGQKITNTVLTGSVPEGTTLKEQLTTNLNNYTIYYSAKENPSAEEWVSEVENYTTVKSFKIEIEELDQASNLEVLYTLIPTENGLKEKEAFESDVNIKYVIKNQTKEEKIEFKVINLTKGQSVVVGQNNNVMLSIKYKTSTESLHESQIVTYELGITNTGNEVLNNTVLSYTVPDGGVYTEFTYAQASNITYTDNEDLKNKEWNIETLKPNETITKEVTIKINKGAEQIVNKADLKDTQGKVLVEIVTDPVKVNKSDICVRMSRKDNYVIELEEGDIIEYNVIVENLSDKEINSLKVKAKIPQNTTFLDDNEGWEYNKEDNIVYANIETIKPKKDNNEEDKENKEHILLLKFKVKVDKFDETVTSSIIENSAIIEDKNSIEYETNIYKCKVTNTRWQINQKAEHANTLKKGNLVKYIIEVKNIGERADYAKVKDGVPEEIQLQKIKIYIDETLVEEKDIFSNNEIDVNFKLKVGQTIKIEIEGIVYDLAEGVDKKEIKNVAQIKLKDGTYLNSEEIINVIENNEINTENPSNPQEPTDPENSDMYSMSGLVWIDKNQNGIRDNGEQILQGVEVVLLNKNGEILKDLEGNEIKTITTITGTYKFSNVKKGEYIVIFNYDLDKYTVTKYQAKNATDEENSDVISKEISINDQTRVVAVTDIIKVTDGDAKNIDIGLVENKKFDLSLEKYVEKVILTNSEESTTYNFEQSTLAKIEVDAKKIAKSSILVQYKIKISNNGDVKAYIKDIIDYIPKELAFNSEMNPEWYLDSEGALHNQTLEKESIGPEETKTVSLVLTKMLNNNSTGTIENLAEIGESTNLEEIKELDSVAGNRKTGEDDMSSASLIISIKTGSPIIYIGIALSILLILGLGIYLINKKVLKGGI